MIDMQLVFALKGIMNQKGINQRELADMIGKDETVISRWFAGKVGISRSSVELLEK
ncbi:MAG: helix-turn-helix transcriptional regulator, partial [Bacteroidaceae bacterium]|nr:helix-turn-helix transcriptional regulator [Bacteroidaceae bacterium]